MQTDVLPPTLKAMRSNRTGRTKRKNRRKAVFSLIYKGFSAFERECFSGEKLSFSGFRTVSHGLRSRKIVAVRLLPLHNVDHGLSIAQALGFFRGAVQLAFTGTFANSFFYP